VVAMPDKIYGEKVCAYVVPKPGRSAPSVKSLGDFLLKAGIAKYKLPERIESIAAFPVTRVGKVDKAAMRADIAKKLADEQVPEPARERNRV
jgi:non-ribosomal peptide synthetase component E (peptide arylation enzyme)